MLDGFPQWLSGKESACHCRRRGFDPWVRKISWSRKWQPTPLFLPGKFHGQRSMAGYSPWGPKGSNTTLCLVSWSCPTLWDPMVCSPPGSSVHGIFQARMLEWVAISFSRGSSWPRDQKPTYSMSHALLVDSLLTKPLGKTNSRSHILKFLKCCRHTVHSHIVYCYTQNNR